MYEKVDNRINHFFIQFIELLAGFLFLFTLYFFNFTEKEKWIVLIIVGISGFCIGANYDLYGNHEILLLTEN